MFKTATFLLCGTMVLAALPAPARDRYQQDPAVMVSPDLTAPWVMQLRRAPAQVQVRQRVALQGFNGQITVNGSQARRMKVRALPQQSMANAGVRITQSGRSLPQPMTQQVAYNGMPRTITREQSYETDPQFLPQEVGFDGTEKAGTIIIETDSKFLYLVQGNGKARRYGVGVGKEGFLWHGTQTITNKREWPDWRPPAEMIKRVREKENRELPVFMAGGPDNPLGARAMYLGSTQYRIHGTNQPWTIGHNVSSGCIRMRNEDVVDLYERVGVGTKVIVR